MAPHLFVFDLKITHVHMCLTDIIHVCQRQLQNVKKAGWIFGHRGIYILKKLQGIAGRDNDLPYQ